MKSMPCSCFLAMFPLHIYKKLFSIQCHLHQQSQVLVTSFENQLSVSYFSLLNNVVDSSVVSTNTVKRIKKSIDEIDEEKSFTVSYLINSFGFSPERAAKVSAHIRFKNSENPNSILALLEKYGFSRKRIADLVRRSPRILLSKEKTIVPKLEFFVSVGMSNDLLGNIIYREPKWLEMSLENSIIPNYKYLKSIVLTDERAVTAIKHNPRLFCKDIWKRLVPNIKVLRELKVPDSSIRYLLVQYAETLFFCSEEFEESVSKVLEMGFDPLKSTFVLALHVVSGYTNKVTWDKCYATYSKWGWSEEDIYMAFRKHPNCMLMSERKISKVMDFLVNKMGLDSKVIAQCPTVLSLSLEKRIIPRFSVIQVLLSRGLMRKQFSVNTVLKSMEKYFLKKFVVPYEKEVPDIYDVYKGKVKVFEV